jgi:catechol 2,3-dioxygenase-like lactoylglutathione lyase family enzyme
MDILHIDHVQLAAPRGCEDEARFFFGELLGLDEIEKPALLRERGGAWFSLGTQQIHVGVDRAFVPAEKAHPAFRTSSEGLGRVAERLTTGGATVTWDDSVPGVRRFFTADPWGNRLEFLAAP